MRAAERCGINSFDTQQWYNMMMKLIFLFPCVILLGVLPTVCGGPIHDAIRAGDVAGVETLLAAPGVSVAVRTEPGGPTPLMLAVALPTGGVEMVELLLEAGADLEGRDNEGRTPLMWAGWKGNATIVWDLIGRGARLEARDGKEVTPLMWAAQGMDAETVKALLEAGAEVDAGDRYGATALMFGAKAGGLEQVRMLLDAGADIHFRPRFGVAVLDRAVKSGSTEMIQLMIESGAEIDAIGEWGKCALATALYSEHPQAVALLLEAGANPYVESVRGVSGLAHGIGASTTNADCLRTLFELVDPFQQEVLDGGLARAARNANPEIFEVLLAAMSFVLSLQLVMS